MTLIRQRYGNLIISNFQVQNCTCLRGKLNSICINKNNYKKKKEKTFIHHIFSINPLVFGQKGDIFQFYLKNSSKIQFIIGCVLLSWKIVAQY